MRIASYDIRKSKRMRQFRPEAKAYRFRVQGGIALFEAKDHYGAEHGIIVLKSDFLFGWLLYRSRRSRCGNNPSYQPNSFLRQEADTALREGAVSEGRLMQFLGETSGQPDTAPLTLAAVSQWKESDAT